MKQILLISLFFLAFQLSAQQFSISGRVTNYKGDPFAGVSVVIKGSSKGTITAFDGTYKLLVNKGIHILQFNYVAPSPFEREVTVTENTVLDIQLGSNEFKLDEVLVSATRAKSNTPMAYSTISKGKMQGLNLGQDLPIIIDQLPSVVTTTDAGAGIGYTGIRVRGTDATRVNVTINGIPYNDPESQGTFWVNMPDFVSSVEDIQLQRGVGTSTNGAAAFGATLNLKTNNPSKDSYATIANTIGSFGTLKHNFQLGTGVKKNFYAEARISKISSDGYIDRAAADLKSFYIEGGFLNENTAIKTIIFGGEERTYQSWYGTPEARVQGDPLAIQAYIDRNYLNDEEAENLLNSGRTYNYYTYENEVDNYSQNHYQLHLTHRFSDKLSANISANYTKGEGYFEQYKEEEELGEYFPNNANADQEGDVIRRRWLDNKYYALIYSVNYHTPKLDAYFGGGLTSYDGDHFGKVIWDSFPDALAAGSQYYFSNGDKRDFNSYIKAEYKVAENIMIFGDLQQRLINYKTQGISSDLLAIDVDEKYAFFNPKVGLTFELQDSEIIYGSVAVGNREPNRDDLINNPEAKPERLVDFELGYRLRASKVSFSANLYHMNYKDQLVLTGALDDVGGPIRQNVTNSYRSGLELQLNYKPDDKWNIEFNSTLSKNKIKEHNYIVFDTQYDPNTFETVSYSPIITKLNNKDISFSPSFIGGSVIDYLPTEQLKFSLISKYVGQQFLDNTQSNTKKIEGYFVNNFNASLVLRPKWVKQLRFDLLVNNIFNEMYESNGYTFSYYYRPQGSNDPAIKENFYYPQAGVNYLLGLTVNL